MLDLGLLVAVLRSAAVEVVRGAAGSAGVRGDFDLA
jgi:hypothetical protein